MLKTHEIFDFQTKNYMVKFSVPQKCKILAAWSLKNKFSFSSCHLILKINISRWIHSFGSVANQYKNHENFDFQTKNYMVRFSIPQKCKILAAWSLKRDSTVPGLPYLK